MRIIPIKSSQVGRSTLNIIIIIALICIMLALIPLCSSISLLRIVQNDVWQFVSKNGLSNLYMAWFANLHSPQLTGEHLRTALGYGALASFIVTSVIGVLAALAIASHRKPSLHGEARFATLSEVKKGGLLNQGAGILLGKFKGKFMQLTGARFVALAAPTRAGKGVGIVIPNLLNWEGSLVCLDIKGENFGLTSGFRSKYQAVYKFDPFSDSKESHCYNPLTYISKDPAQAISDIQSIARIFWARSDTDPIWNDSSVNLFQGLTLFLIDVQKHTPLTMGNVLRLAGQFGSLNNKGFQEFCATLAEEGKKISPRALAALNQFFSLPDETRNSVLGTFNAALQIFSNPMVDAATSKDDFDLRDLRKRRQTVYLCVAANRLGAAAPLMNLFFSQLIQVNTTELPEQNPDLKHSVLVLLDEFTSLGKVEIIEKSISYIAGYNLRLLLIYQSQAQLAATYGADSARNIITNCGCQILFAPREQSDAEEYSKILGNTTVKAKSKSRSVGLNFGKNNNPTDSTSEQQRALLLPQEMKEIGKENCIVIIEDVKPIMANKIMYYKDKKFTERLLPAVSVAKIEISQEMLGLHALPEKKLTEKEAFIQQMNQNVIERRAKQQQAYEAEKAAKAAERAARKNKNQPAAPSIEVADSPEIKAEKEALQAELAEIFSCFSEEERALYVETFMPIAES